MNRIATLLAACALIFTPLAASAQSITPPTGGSSLTTPVSPTNGGSGVANTGNLTWNAAQTFSFTSAQTMTFPAASTTLAGLGTAQTFSAANIFSAAGAASTPGLSVTGVPFAGTGTISTPQLYVNSGASAPTTWSTSGTLIGINAPSGFAGNFLDVHLNGGASLFSVNSVGAIQTGNQVVSGSTVTGASLVSSGGTLTLGGGGGVVLSAAGGSILHWGPADTAAPTAQGIQFQSVVAGTTNTAGVNTTVKGSLSTGSGLSGDLIAQTGGTGAASTTPNTAATGWTLKGASQHFQFGGNIAPAITSCGTGSPSITGTDNAGVVTIGTTATACTITFHTAFGATPVCVLNDQTALVNLTSYTVSTAALVLTMAANSGNLISYICNGA